MKENLFVRTKYSKLAKIIILPVTLFSIPFSVFAGVLFIKAVQDISGVIVILPGFMFLVSVGLVIFYIYDFLPNYKTVKIQNDELIVNYILYKKRYPLNQTHAMDYGSLYNPHLGVYGNLIIEVKNKRLFFDSRYNTGLDTMIKELQKKDIPKKSLHHWKKEAFNSNHMLFIIAPFVLTILYKIIVLAVVFKRFLSKDDFIIALVMSAILLITLFKKYGNRHKVAGK